MKADPWVQKWESKPYKTEIVGVDDASVPRAQLRHANEQLAIQRDYPRRKRR